jgi:tetratricopeptide (TPR) repeat protein
VRSREGTFQTTTVRPGALTELLAELVQGPSVDGREGAGWELPLAAGESIGRFEILREVGRGGFGVVYEARDSELGRSVAFKAVRTSGLTELKADRLLAEAEAAARLAHPNIVHLYDLGRCERGAFLILELLKGKTLAERLEEGPLPAREALRVAVEVARGLAHAHTQGVVHRDLKPGNVFLCEDGQVKLLDFGLAHVFGRGGTKGGTPAYMAPEQARGEVGDERADVFGLGVMLSELLTGKLPFADAEKGIPEGGKVPTIVGAPAALDRLLGRMLARDPAGRPATGAETHRELSAIQKALEPRRGLRVAVLVAAGAVVGAGIFAWAWQRPLPPGRLLTAIADTDNQTGDPDIDGVGELFRSSLEQSKRVAVMTRSRLLDLLREKERPLPKAIGEAEASAAARKAQAQLVLVPSVRPVGNGYELAVHAVNLARDEALFGIREPAAAKASLYAAIDRVTTRVRKALNEDAREAPKAPVSAVEAAPANPEALRLLAEGRRLESEYGWDGALEAFEKAAAADPEFPLPRLEIVQCTVGVFCFSVEGRAFEAHVRALRRNLHRLPEGDRPWAESVVLMADRGFGSSAELLASLDRAIEARPEDPRPYIHATNTLLFGRGDLHAAQLYLDRAVALAPLAGLGDVIDYLVLAERLDEALARVRRWTEESPNVVSFGNLAAVHLARDEIPEALAVARQLNARWKVVHADPFVDADALEEVEELLRGARFRAPAGADWLALRGRVREALAGHDELVRSGGLDPLGPDPLIRRGSLLMPRGDLDAIEKVLRADVLRPVHLWMLAALGNLERAEALANTGFHDHRLGYRMFRAIRTLKRGDPEGALHALATIHAPSSNVVRGEVLAELGRDREAVEAFRRYRRLRVANSSMGDRLFNSWNYPRSLYLEAAALERLGDKDEARKVLGRLLHLWERADPDLPLLAQAKGLKKKLGEAR